MSIQRGHKKGLFTWKDSDTGTHVIMDYEDYKDMMGYIRKMRDNFHFIHLRLTEPASMADVHEAWKIAGAAFMHDFVPRGEIDV